MSKFIYEGDELVLLEPIKKHGNHDQSSHGQRGMSHSIQRRVKENGGLTLDMVDGSEPPDGFMVAKGKPMAAIVSAKDFYDPVKGPKIVADFVKTHKQYLVSNDSPLGRSHLGIWHNKENNQVYLDVADNFKVGSVARIAGSQRNQISIWDVANFKEIETGGTGDITKGKPNSDDSVANGSGGYDGRSDRSVESGSLAKGSGAKVAVELIRFV